ncbi:transposase [Streptomyces massasporeus]|uniref:transposase n=1 Tax=Streptomyces massasporeus TaxID=67324 RepID=UPI0036B88370
MVRRHELTDQRWELLAPLIPRAATGRPRVSDRQVVNGMVYKIRTGISWRDLPKRYWPWQTVYTRFRSYAVDGVFARALRQNQSLGGRRRRNIVERCFNRLKGFRGIGTRYDKTATSYEAAVSLASFLLWTRSV